MPAIYSWRCELSCTRGANFYFRAVMATGNIGRAYAVCSAGELQGMAMRQLEKLSRRASRRLHAFQPWNFRWGFVRRYAPNTIALLAISASIMSASIPSSALSEEPGVINGFGTLTCRVFNERTVSDKGYRQNELSMGVLSWVQGYLSGLNTFTLLRLGRFVDVSSVPLDNQWALLVDFCKRKPEGAIFDAAQEVLGVLTPIEMCPAGQEQAHQGSASSCI
jgi:hypothetical protein